MYIAKYTKEWKFSSASHNDEQPFAVPESQLQSFNTIEITTQDKDCEESNNE